MTKTCCVTGHRDISEKTETHPGLFLETAIPYAGRLKTKRQAVSNTSPFLQQH